MRSRGDGFGLFFIILSSIILEDPQESIQKGISITITGGYIPLVSLILGNKGKGKTKLLLDKVNTEVKTTLGNICYLDKSTKHMFELNNRVRLINVSDFMIEDTDEFLGFVAGIISQDHDLEQMYFDSFLVSSHLENKDITPAVRKLQKYSEAFHVDFCLSVSMDEADIPAELKELVAVAL